MKIALHDSAQELVKHIHALGLAESSAIVISTDVNTGELVARFIEDSAIKRLKTQYLGQVLNTHSVYAFGVGALAEDACVTLSFIPVRGSVYDDHPDADNTNLGYMFRVYIDSTESSRMVG